MDVAAGFEPLQEFIHKSRLNQAAFVVPQFVPRVWKKNMHAVQAICGQHVFHHFDRVVLKYADVLNAQFTHAFEQCADAGFVHFATQKIVLRSEFGDLCRGIPHAKTNFQNQSCAAPESFVCVESMAIKRQHKTWPQIRQCLGLTAGGATGAGDKTFDGFGMFNMRWGLVVHGLMSKRYSHCACGFITDTLSAW